MSHIIVITGTDTGVGKTTLTALLASHLRAGGASVAALKPVSSGGRDDARVLKQSLRGALTLDEINPWHFRASLAPLLAARKERRRLELREVVVYVSALTRRFETILVEGAGGLLTPLGEGFSTRELIGALGADVLIVARNQLGVVNHVRLTLAALAPVTAARAKVVLMSPSSSTTPSRTNAGLLGEFMDPAHLFVLPWLQGDASKHTSNQVRRVLSSLLHS